MKRDLMAVVALVGLASGLAAAQAPFEVSEDGRSVATPDLDGVSVGYAAEGVEEAPFPLTPDWTFDQRFAVGAVRIADIDLDGLNDLVVATFKPNSFPAYDDYYQMIFYNTGSGLEAAPSWQADVEYYSGDIQVGDINLDGWPDLFDVCGTFGPPPRVYFGAPEGMATVEGWVSAPPQTGWATSGTLFDIDGDGDLDALTTNQGVAPNPYRPMYFFRNDGGTLETSPSWQSAEDSIQNTTVAADFDNDGDLDIGVAKWSSFESGVYLNSGGTLDVNPSWTVGTTGTDKGVAAADVDGNGWVDLVVGDDPTRLYSNDVFSFSETWQAMPPFDGPQENVFHDVDGDGDPDFAEVHFSDGRAHIYMNTDGVLSSTPNWTFDATQVGNTLAFGDLNNDGFDDLAVGYSGDTSIRVFYGIPPEPPACPADLDGSGDIGSADLNVVLGNFGCVQGDDPVACVGDVDGDGDTDSGDLNLLLAVFGAACE